MALGWFPLNKTHMGGIGLIVSKVHPQRPPHRGLPRSTLQRGPEEEERAA